MQLVALVTCSLSDKIPEERQGEMNKCRINRIDFSKLYMFVCRFINVEHLFACSSFAHKQKKKMLKILIPIKRNVQLRKQWTFQMNLWQFTCSSSSISLKCGCVWPFFIGFSLPNVSCLCLPSVCHVYQAFKSNLLLSSQFKCLKIQFKWRNEYWPGFPVSYINIMRW